MKKYYYKYEKINNLFATHIRCDGCAINLKPWRPDRQGHIPAYPGISAPQIHPQTALIHTLRPQIKVLGRPAAARERLGGRGHFRNCTE